MKSRLIPASGSPHRKSLLHQLCPEFETVRTDIDEKRISGESPMEMTHRLAQHKALPLFQTHDSDVKTGGDGIQSGAGNFATKIEGSYTEIIGLPLRHTHQLLFS